MHGSARLDSRHVPYKTNSVAWWLLINAAVLIGIAFAF